MGVKYCEPFEDASALTVPGFTGNSTSFSTTQKVTGLGSLRVDANASFWAGYNFLSMPTIGAGLAKVRIACHFWSDSLSAGQIITLREGATLHGYVALLATGFVEIRNGAGTLLDTSDVAITASQFYHLSLLFDCHDTTGIMTLNINGIERATFAGDTRNAGTAGVIDRLFLGGNEGASGTNSVKYYDNLVIADDAGSILTGIIPEVIVEADYPSGNGATSGLTGSDGNSTDNYLLVDETGTPSTADYNGSATPDTFDVYAASDLATVTGVVYAVQVRNQMFKSDGGAIQGRNRILSDASSGTGVDVAVSVTAGPVDTVFELDPDGSVQWIIAQVNAVQPGFEVRT